MRKIQNYSATKPINFYYLLILMCLIIIPIDAISQIKGFSTVETEKLFQEDKLSQSASEKFISKEIMPVGNIVDPLFYKVGPGDVLAIQNLTVSTTQSLCSVTPENTVLIPRIGEVNLKDMTLDEARKFIVQTIKERNPNALVYVSLYQPRSVLVTLTGNVKIQGNFVFPSSYKVSTALKVNSLTQADAFQQNYQSFDLYNYQERLKSKDKAYANAGTPYKRIYSSRNILIIHSDGTSNIADIEKGKALSNAAYDPFIKEGDLIQVPYELDEFPSISILGAVRRPAVLLYKKGDKASLLLKFGFGPLENVDLDNVFLYLTDSENKVKLQVDSSLNLIGSDYDLHPNSVIIVGQINNDQKKNFGYASIQGCVNSPGVYPIKIGETRLKKIIEIAGNLTNDANVDYSYVLRKENIDIMSRVNRTEFSEFFKYSDLTLEDTTRFKLDLIFNKSMVSCNIRKAVYENSAEDNVLLEDGDLIYIAETPKSVYVFGQVNQPGYILYEPNKTMDWYIQKAGGIAVGGKDGRARIIRGSNKIWIEPEKDNYVIAGDWIYVPRPPDLPPGVELQQWSFIAGALASVVATISFIINILR